MEYTLSCFFLFHHLCFYKNQLWNIFIRYCDYINRFSKSYSNVKLISQLKTFLSTKFKLFYYVKQQKFKNLNII